MTGRAKFLTVVVVAFVVVAVLIVAVLWSAHSVKRQSGSSPPGPYYADVSELLAIYSADSSKLVANLSSDRPIIVMESLGTLERRKDPAGQDKARELLHDEDDYVWFNAALYLASLGDRETIPYLIKGLQHPASRSRGEVASYLESLTQQRFGRNQELWIAWWQEQHPDSDFDFSYARQ